MKTTEYGTITHIGPKHRFWEWLYGNNPNTFKNRIWEQKACTVPGSGGHKGYRCFRMFDKWYDRPRKSHHLYWKLHKKA